MMNSRHKQIRNKIIGSYGKNDDAKLARLEAFIRRRFADKVRLSVLEPFLLFSKGEDQCYGWRTSLTESQVKRFNIHRADMLLVTNHDDEIFLELDGPIHDIKTESTENRNRLYEINSVKYVVVSESELKHRLAIPKSRPLTQDQINNAFAELLEEIL